MRFYSISILICWTCYVGVGEAHPFHASIAEAEWNAKTKNLEVSLWVHPTDLEKALSRRSKKPIDPDKTTNLYQLSKADLSEVFIIKDANGKQKKLDWVGKEIKVKGAWLYFQFPLPNGPEGVRISNRIFFELLKDQENTITIQDRKHKRRQSVVCTFSRPEVIFRWTKSHPSKPN